MTMNSALQNYQLEDQTMPKKNSLRKINLPLYLTAECSDLG